MLIDIVIGVLVLLAIFCVIAAMQPTEFGVSRSATIKAPPEKIFELVNTLSNWNSWSPWAKLDPNARTTFEGPSSGAGAIMRWAGNNKVGAGSMTITESHPSQLIKLRLDFLKPMQVTNTGEFNFASSGNQTTVTWSMRGERNFVAKAMGLVMNCDKMIGGMYEKGFANIKAIVEA